MAAVVSLITPGRGRPGDLATVFGTGFNVTVGQNQVTFGGIPAGVNLATETQLQVVIPGGIPVDQHVQVVVTNLADPTPATWFWWSKDTVANTAAMVLRQKIPGNDEKLRGLGRSIKNMSVAEARFFERLSSKIELIPDLLSAKGDFCSHAAEALGLRRAPAGTAGQPFVSAVSDLGGQFQGRQCQTLQWGVLLDTAPSPSDPLDDYGVAGGNDNCASFINNATTKEVVLQAGQLALVSMRERASATSRINRIQVLVEGVVVKDLQNGDPEFPGPGIRNGQSLTFYPGTQVDAGDSVEVRVFRNNTTTACFVLVYALVA